MKGGFCKMDDYNGNGKAVAYQNGRDKQFSLYGAKRAQKPKRDKPFRVGSTLVELAENEARTWNPSLVDNAD